MVITEHYFQRVTKEVRFDRISCDDLFATDGKNPPRYLTDRGDDGADKVKATGKIPAASLVDDAGGGSVAVGVQELVQPLQGRGATSQVVPSKRVINPPEFRGLSFKRQTLRNNVSRRESHPIPRKQRYDILHNVLYAAWNERADNVFPMLHPRCTRVAKHCDSSRRRTCRTSRSLSSL